MVVKAYLRSLDGAVYDRAMILAWNFVCEWACIQVRLLTVRRDYPEHYADIAKYFETCARIADPPDLLRYELDAHLPDIVLKDLGLTVANQSESRKSRSERKKRRSQRGQQ